MFFDCFFFIIIFLSFIRFFYSGIQKRIKFFLKHYHFLELQLQFGHTEQAQFVKQKVDQVQQRLNANIQQALLAPAHSLIQVFKFLFESFRTFIFF